MGPLFLTSSSLLVSNQGESEGTRRVPCLTLALDLYPYCKGNTIKVTDVALNSILATR